MTAAALSERWGFQRDRVLAYGSLAIGSLFVGYAATRSPLLAIAGVIVLAGVAFAATHQLAALSVLAASFLFDAYLTKGHGLVTVGKLIGGLAFVAWVLDWGLRKSTVVTNAALWWLFGLAIWLVPSTAAALDQSSTLVTDIRYVNFIILFFLVLQAVNGDRRRAAVVIDLIVFAVAVASVVGIESFLVGHQQRAMGPISDPNDFAFVLASYVPVVIYRIRWAPRGPRRVVAVLALPLVLACILATFSRGALVALVAAAAFALATRRIRFRWLLVALAIVGISVVAAFRYQPKLVGNSFTLKKHVATTNTNSRLGFWSVAIKEWRSSPVVGVGPGGFGPALPAYQFPTGEVAPTTHNAYLNILSELGAPGLICFVGFILVSWSHLRRPHVDDKEAHQLQQALAVGFVVALVGSMFLTEQYYAPLWVLSAMGISLSPDRKAGLVPAAIGRA